MLVVLWNLNIPGHLDKSLKQHSQSTHLQRFPVAQEVEQKDLHHSQNLLQLVAFEVLELECGHLVG